MVEERGVHRGERPVDHLTVPFVDTPEDVQLRVQADVQGRSELRAAHLQAVRKHAVQNSVRRAVRDQHVRQA